MQSLHSLTLSPRLFGFGLGVQTDPSSYSSLVCGADVTLDTYPFGGGLTLSESIRCNVPFVTSGELQVIP